VQVAELQIHPLDEALRLERQVEPGDRKVFA